MCNRGAAKVFAHLMFGVLVITAKQLLHLLESSNFDSVHIIIDTDR
jgi:hypothetical protein